MDMLAESVDAVIGVNTHTDTHTACLIDNAGREIATVTVEATPAGYTTVLAWALDHAPGPRLCRAVEGCRSHGAGLVRSGGGGPQVLEAGRPASVEACHDRKDRATRGRSGRYGS